MRRNSTTKLISAGVCVWALLAIASYANGLSDRDMRAAYCLGYYIAEFDDLEIGDLCQRAEQGEKNVCSAEVVKKERLLGYLRSTGAFEAGDVWSISMYGHKAYRDCKNEMNREETRQHSKECLERYGYTSKEGQDCTKSLVLPSCVPLETCYRIDFLPF